MQHGWEAETNMTTTTTPSTTDILRRSVHELSVSVEEVDTALRAAKARFIAHHGDVRYLQAAQALLDLQKQLLKLQDEVSF
jgi:hypothetical protein